jgi:hypothetical protein
MNYRIIFLAFYGPRAEKLFKKQLVSKLVLKSVFRLKHVSGKLSMAII